MAEFLAQSGGMKGDVDYSEMFASMAGEFVDLRGDPTMAASIPIRRSATRSATPIAELRGRTG